MSAGQALKHAYFKELREQDKSMADTMGNPGSQMSAVMRMT
jgi:hypothetical protein